MNEIHWLAGLLDGEASFCTDSSIRIKVGMTDADTIEKARRILGVGSSSVSKLPSGKAFYSLGVSGHRAAAWMMTLFPIMSGRRQKKMAEALSQWREHPLMGRGSGHYWSRRTHCSNGHEYMDETTFQRSTGGRGCRVCARDASRRCYSRASR